MGVPEINPLQNHPKLIDSDLLCRLLALRPRVAVALKSLLPQTEAYSVSVQFLQQLTGFIAEQKQASGKRVL